MNIDPSSSGLSPIGQPSGFPDKATTDVKASGNHEQLSELQPASRTQLSRIKGRFLSLFKSQKGEPQTLRSEPANAFSVQKAAPETSREKIQLAVDAELAAYPYHRDLSKVSSSTPSAKENQELSKLGSWDLAKPLALAAGKATGLSTKGSEGFIYDKKSGLTAYLLHNPTTPGEVRLVFGGTTSGKNAGGMEKRSLLNGGFTLKQWVANAKNAVLGKVPDSFTQAKNLTTQVQNMMANDPRYEGYKLTLSGHSKGGAEASYAALTRIPPIEATCFSSAELGQEARANIPRENKEKADSFVRHYKIKGDPIPNVGLLNKHLAHVGAVTTLPSKNILQGPMDRHDKFTRQVHAFTGTKE